MKPNEQKETEEIRLPVSHMLPDIISQIEGDMSEILKTKEKTGIRELSLVKTKLEEAQMWLDKYDNMN